MGNTAETQHAPTADPGYIVKTLRLLFHPGQVVELRAPHTRKGTVSGYFDNFDKLADAAAELSGTVPGVYVTLNPVKPELLARTFNRVEAYAKHTTADSDIVTHCWLPTDFDAVRPSGISSSDLEHRAAIERAGEARAWLETLGFPKGIFADSANGAHLLQRIDLPNTPESTEIVKKCFEALASRFSDATVNVDQTCFNPARIWKLYGTLACKGDSTAARLHRLAKIINVGDIPVVPLEILQKLASLAPEQPHRQSNNGHQPWSLDDYLSRHNITVMRESAWNGGRRLILVTCPWNPEHKRGEAFIVQFANGAVSAGCHHNSCFGRGWRDLRLQYEPSYGREHAAKWEPGDETFHLTELGNAQRLVRLHGQDLRFCNERGWYAWDGKRWKHDGTGEIKRRGKDTVRSIYLEAAHCSDGKMRDALGEHARRSEAKARKDAMIGLAESEPGIPVSHDELDRDPWLLNVANGTIDLRIGRLRPHARGDLITKIVPIEFDPSAECPGG